MSIVEPHRGFKFDSVSGRRAGLISGRVRRQAAAERVWGQFAATLLASHQLDQLANRLARKYDRLAG